mmetsp:Transcript_25704/g.101373  ORF Transcript_25704/g.101373 Transcript_25704/m.101373 type:complete len:199 (+) Transcript_25704:1642-2238(+)
MGAKNSAPRVSTSFFLRDKERRRPSPELVCRPMFGDGLQSTPPLCNEEKRNRFGLRDRPICERTGRAGEKTGDGSSRAKRDGANSRKQSAPSSDDSVAGNINTNRTERRLLVENRARRDLGDQRDCNKGLDTDAQSLHHLELGNGLVLQKTLAAKTIEARGRVRGRTLVTMRFGRGLVSRLTSTLLGGCLQQAQNQGL